MALSTLVYAFGDSIDWFVAGRIGAGLAYGAFTPAAIGLIVRHFPDGSGRPRIGRLQSLELAGMAVGPLLAVIGKVTIGVVPTLVAAAVLTIVVALPALLARVQQHVGGRSAPHLAAEQHPSFFGGSALLRHRSVMAAALVVTAFYIPIGAYDALFPRFLTDIGASDWVIGAALMAFAVPSVFLASWAGRQVDRLGPFRAAGRGGAANIAVVVSYGLVRVPMVDRGHRPVRVGRPDPGGRRRRRRHGLGGPRPSGRHRPGPGRSDRHHRRRAGRRRGRTAVRRSVARPRCSSPPPRSRPAPLSPGCA